jgi:hypothetical protein
MLRSCSPRPRTCTRTSAPGLPYSWTRRPAALVDVCGCCHDTLRCVHACMHMHGVVLERVRLSDSTRCPCTSAPGASASPCDNRGHYCTLLCTDAATGGAWLALIGTVCCGCSNDENSSAPALTEPDARHPLQVDPNPVQLYGPLPVTTPTHRVARWLCHPTRH